MRVTGGVKTMSKTRIGDTIQPFAFPCLTAIFERPSLRVDDKVKSFRDGRRGLVPGIWKAANPRR